MEMNKDLMEDSDIGTDMTLGVVMALCLARATHRVVLQMANAC
jgi:hypothetical protein